MSCRYNFHNLEILTFLMSITPFPSYDYKVQRETQTPNQRGNAATPYRLMNFESLQLLVTVCLLLQFFLSCCIMLSENYNNLHTSWRQEFAQSSWQLFEKLKKNNVRCHKLHKAISWIQEKQMWSMSFMSLFLVVNNWNSIIFLVFLFRIVLRYATKSMLLTIRAIIAESRSCKTNFIYVKRKLNIQ